MPDNFGGKLRLILYSIRHMEQGAGCTEYNVVTAAFQTGDSLQYVFIISTPDVFPIYKSRKQDFILRETVCCYKCCGLLSFHKVKANAVKGQFT